MLNLDHRIPYTCSGCRRVTYGPPGQVAITCGHCGTIDIGTELARQRWKNVAEIRMANQPEVVTMVAEPQSRRLVVLVVVAAALALAAVVAGLVLL